MITSKMKVERMSVGVERKERKREIEKYRDMEDMAGDGGQSSTVASPAMVSL